MATFNPYLHFTGNTEEVFNFYKSVIGGEFTKLQRFKDLPKSDEFEMPEAFLEKIMMIELPLGKTSMLTGSDAVMERDGHKFTNGDNFHIAITADSKAEADKLYNGLSEGGIIEMPFAKSFGDTYFGMFADKYGIQWTVAFDANNM